MAIRRYRIQKGKDSRKKAKPNLPGVEMPLLEDGVIRLHEDEDQRVAEAAEE